MAFREKTNAPERRCVEEDFDTTKGAKGKGSEKELQPWIGRGFGEGGKI
jgi:hypothetical protein